MVDHQAMREAYNRAMGCNPSPAPDYLDHFKKPNMGKNGKKFFRPISLFNFFIPLKNVFFKDNLKIVLRSSTTSKKICTLRFTAEESATIIRAATDKNMSVEQFFNYLFQEIVRDAKRKTDLSSVQ